MMESFMENHLTELTGCVEKLVVDDLEQMQSLIGFELGMAQIILEKIQLERHELMNEPV
ncbi:hypothetical protein ACS5NO_17375 [Larkinella sp. GY13]|uniref:hypothetical protein n=1 Tax=Larkinella sp. GY13 TaxID=3453720 RepID=UPI003EEA0C66